MLENNPTVHEKRFTDKELLDFAESHPEAAKASIDRDWLMAGRGFREEWFNFRGAIADAMLAERAKEPKS